MLDKKHPTQDVSKAMENNLIKTIDEEERGSTDSDLKVVSSDENSFSSFSEESHEIKEVQTSQ